MWHLQGDGNGSRKWSKTWLSILLLTNTLFHSMSRTHYLFVLRLFIYICGGKVLGGDNWSNEITAGRSDWLWIPPHPQYIMFILTIKSGNYQLTRTLTHLSYSLPCGTNVLSQQELWQTTYLECMYVCAAYTKVIMYQLLGTTLTPFPTASTAVSCLTICWTFELKS